jgi:cytochrome b involved in lipid metabolism
MEENQSQSTPPQSKPAFPMMGLVIAGVVIVLAIGGFMLMSRGSKTTPADTANQETVGSQMPAIDASTTPVSEMLAEKSYTLQDIAVHAAKDDCWFAVEGKVYDVTQYIAGGKHPGKEAIIQGCGKDATELFNTRPMGSGTPHSDKARGFLTNFQIGILAE